MLTYFRRMVLYAMLAVLLLLHFEVAVTGTALETEEAYTDSSRIAIQTLEKKLDAIESKYAKLSEDNAKLIKAIVVCSQNSVNKYKSEILSH